jgi:hypothetical protein
MSMHDDLQAEQPPKRGMSSTTKVLLVLGSIAGLCLMLCCGGGVYLFYKAKDMVSISTSPQDVKQRTQEIVQIDVPDDFVPAQSMKFAVPNVMSMKWAIYTKGANTQSILMLMEKNQPGMAAQGGAGAKQQRDQMLQAMRQQHGQQGGGNQFNTTINEESSETREFTVNGKKIEFDFVKGTRPGNGAKARQVVGVFPGRDGIIMLMLIVDESEYDEAAVERMIQSIRLRGETASAESDESDDTPEEMPANAEDPKAADSDGETESTSEPTAP